MAGEAMSALREMRDLLVDDLYTLKGQTEDGEIWEAPGRAVRVVLTPADGRVAALVVADGYEEENGDADADWLDGVLP
jgi:hypothetical protein